MKNIFIVVTGGPSGGKTTLINTLKKEFGAQIAVVPEAASILYSGGLPRVSSVQGKIHTQRAIYGLQTELEEMIAFEHPGKLIVCDRGRLDSAAYWPENSEIDFLSCLKTTEAKEISRYDWVLHLDTASVEDFDRSNPVRLENHNQALELNQKILNAWKNHPQRIVITNHRDFLSKVTIARDAIQNILESSPQN
jgi:nicotinamide riboside kinase